MARSGRRPNPRASAATAIAVLNQVGDSEERVLTPLLVPHGSPIPRHNHVSPVAAPDISVVAYLPHGHTFG